MIAIHLRDLGEPLVAAWRHEFHGVDGVTVSRGDIFSDKPGPIGPDDPIDIKADAIVSPANSFGFMDGGIDALYTYQFGSQLQERLQAVLARDHGGELPVGAAVIVPTDHHPARGGTSARKKPTCSASRATRPSPVSSSSRGAPSGRPHPPSRTP